MNIEPVLVVSAPDNFAGTDGRFEFESGEPLTTFQFTLWAIDGGFAISAYVRGFRTGPNQVAIYGPGPVPRRFIGQTSDGRHVVCTGGFALRKFGADSSGPSLEYEIVSGELDVSVPVVEGSAEQELLVIFDLENLLFRGVPETNDICGLTEEQLLKHGPLPVFPESLSIALPGRPVVLRRALNYPKLSMPLRGGTLKTAQLMTRIADRSELEEVTATAQYVCELLTLATGIHVTWMHRHVWRQEDRSYVAGAARGGQSIPCTATGQGLMDYGAPQELRQFVETTFARYVEIRTALEGFAVTNAYASGLSGDFLESKALQLSALAEQLVKRVLKICGGDVPRMPAQAANRLRQLLSSVTRTFVNGEPHATQQERRALDLEAQHVCSAIAGTERASLKARLTTAAEQLGIRFHGRELKWFIDTRNSLAHDLTFHDAQLKAERDRWQQYQQARFIVDMLLLGLLGYRGPYVDRRTNQRRVFEGGDV